VAKARNGEGSIFPTKGSNGQTKWVVEVSLGYGPDGKRRRTRRQFDTQKEAVEARLRLGKANFDGTLTTISGETVRTYGLAWVREVKALQVRQTTAADYEARLLREVFPVLGGARMIDLKPAHIDKWMASLKRSGRSAATINGARALLNGLCKHAYRQGVIPTNPVLATDPVKRQKGDPTRVKEPWTHEETWEVLEAAWDDELDTFLQLMIHTGMRPGEALGLRWEDVDLANKRLSITGTLKEARLLTPSGVGVVQQIRNEPKTTASRRKLPIDEALAESLSRQLMRQSLHRMISGDKWKETGYVLTTSVGTPYSLSNLRKKFHRLLEQIGVRYIRLHDLRHTVARLSLDIGNIPIEQTSQALGHTRIDTTKQIYAGYVPRFNEEFIAGMSRILPPPRNPTPPEDGSALLNQADQGK
jgi:integrase